MHDENHKEISKKAILLLENNYFKKHIKTALYTPYHKIKNYLLVEKKGFLSNFNKITEMKSDGICGLPVNLD